MSAFLAAVAKKFPKFAPIQARIAAPETSLDALRQDIWAKRFEYWYRKISSSSSTWAAAKTEACAVKQVLSNPSDITYKQLGTAFVWGVQIAGCFAIGEMIARRNMRGYPVGEHPGSEAAHH